MNSRILIFGDSIVWGAWDTEGGWANRLKNYAKQQAVRNKFLNYDEVYPLGISGDTSTGLLKRYSTEFNSRVDSDMQMAAIIAIGINDSQYTFPSDVNEVPINLFKSNISEIIHTPTDAPKKLIFVGLTPVDDKLRNSSPGQLEPGYNNAYVEKYDEVLKKLAGENNLPFIDLYYLFLANNHADLLEDGLHPNTRGHELIYNHILSELKNLGILQ